MEYNRYRFKPNNIMHILHDDVMPVLHTLRALGHLGYSRVHTAVSCPSACVVLIVCGVSRLHRLSMTVA